MLFDNIVGVSNLNINVHKIIKNDENYYEILNVVKVFHFINVNKLI